MDRKSKRPFPAPVFPCPDVDGAVRGINIAQMVRKLGAARWQKLHRLIYAIAILGVVHFWWLVKKDITEPLIFGALLGILLLARAVFSARKASASRQPAAARSQTV